MKKFAYGILLVFSVLVGCTKEELAEECTETTNNNCICTKDYRPVCGCNKKTYSNACMAECVGITKYTQGACQ